MQTSLQKNLIGTALVIVILLTGLLLFMYWGEILDRDGTYRPPFDLVEIIAFGFVAYFRWIWLSIFPSPMNSAACKETGHSHDRRIQEQLERLTYKPQLAFRKSEQTSRFDPLRDTELKRVGGNQGQGRTAAS